ncbi:MAG TPA: MOSC domain-containing protein [Bryobacteraceae bacterium]|jgi:MOSC domain-containing protein YiiM|nr:MOSC domain-containing protein [Bryobacteraceae bacterium]
MAIVCGVFVGKPKQLEDARGRWVSSIFRDPIAGPVRVSADGLEGDAVAQPYHGGPDGAICVHLADHYRFWNANHGMQLGPGNVGENITLADVAEEEICVGDIVRLGTALVQVSGPRVPCANQARRIGRRDWVKLTVRENRTGFYLRVLEAGVLETGDPYVLEERLNEGASIPALNRCAYLDFDPAFAMRMLQMPGLAEWWKQQMRERLGEGDEHWMARRAED